MGKKKKIQEEDLIVPPQDHRICGVICICQMTMVLSCVAVVYLTVAIYVPYFRASDSGINPVPAMCQTVRAPKLDLCEWVTCSEWCLSKSSGSCTQIFVLLRKNGSDIFLANCTNTTNKTCFGIDHEKANKYRCIADQCKNLTGTFNCTEGSCINISDYYECLFKNSEPPKKCSGRRGKITCQDLHGLHDCKRGTCSKIMAPYNCNRRCVDAPTRNKNAILLSGDNVYLSQCQKALVTGTDHEVWNENSGYILMASCFAIEPNTENITASDCINGTLLEKNILTDLTNITFLNHLSVTNEKVLDETQVVAPFESELIISNESRLQINMEGCVNTLMDECKEFLKDYGKDGSDQGARARFPCFYAERNVSTVYGRFNLDRTYKEFLLAFIVPSSLFVVSCTILILCQRTVEVGDDAKMRFKKRGANELGAEGVEASGEAGGGDNAMDL